MWLVLVLLVHCGCVGGLDNGLALTPPMGWATGTRFECNTDCNNYPDDCISETLIKTTADAIVQQGLHKVGYNYLSIGDCWSNKSRDSQGRLQADDKRFPSGMKALVDYVHKRGLKLGLYLDVGNSTCHGYPGSQGRFQTDAQTLAGWGLDMVTLDACHIQETRDMDKLFPQMVQALNKTGRSMLLDCHWPVYQIQHGLQPNYALISSTCNMYKTYPSMHDSWVDLLKLLKHEADNAKLLVNFTGPGHWNNIHQVYLGNYGLSLNQQRLQMALWSVLGAPLFISADLRHIRPEVKVIMADSLAISMSQQMTSAGYQKAVFSFDTQVRVWTRRVQPKGSFAIALTYENISGGPSKVAFKLEDIGLTTAGSYNFTDVFSGQFLGNYQPWFTYNGLVNPTGTTFIYALAIP